MKKTKLSIRALCALFALLMCVSCFTIFPVAADNPIIKVNAGEGKAGETVTVTVSMAGNPGIASMKVLVGYDSDILTPVSAGAGSALAGSAVTSNFGAPEFDPDEGILSFLFIRASNTKSNGSFFTMTFKVKAGTDATAAPITLDCSEATNQTFDDISVTAVGGSVAITPDEEEKEQEKEEEKKDVSIKLRTKAHKIKYMVGRSSSKFEPDAYATRYEVVECFYNLFDVDVMVNNSKSFKDVSPKYNAMVNLFASAGVVKGYDDGKFKGDNTITRAEFCVLIVNLMGLDISKAKDQGFPDVKGKNWYVSYVNAVAKAGYVKGRDTGMFDPNGLITRAEVATLINRITGVDINAATTCIYGDVSPNKWYFKQVAAAAK